MFNQLSHYRGDFALPSLFNNMDSMLNGALRDLSGRFDLQEDKDGNYFLEFALPGYKQADVEVELKDNLLVVTAKNEARGERRSSVTVWADIDPDKVAAVLEDGLLRVTLPKLAVNKPRRIKVS